MAIVCSKCKIGIAIAKYYPLTKKEDYVEGDMTIGGVDSKDNAGWYQQGSRMQDLLNEFFIKHKHKFDFTNDGGSQYYLGYESDGRDWHYEQKKIRKNAHQHKYKQVSSEIEKIRQDDAWSQIFGISKEQLQKDLPKGKSFEMVEQKHTIMKCRCGDQQHFIDNV